MEISSSQSSLDGEAHKRKNLFFLISDLHFGDLPQLAVDEFLAEVELQAPTAVICSGDITLHSRPNEFALARTFFTKLETNNVPIIFTCGNHDMGGSLHEQLSRIAGVKNIVTGYTDAVTELQGLFNSFIVGKPHVIAHNSAQLDSISRFENDIFILLRSQHRKKERIKRDQVQWCQNALNGIQDLSECRLHFVAHHSLWQDEGGDKHSPLDRRRRLEAELLGPLHFDTYIHGHNHRFTYQNTTTPKLNFRIRRIGVPTMCTRNRSYERGFVAWNPSFTSIEPALIVLQWQKSDVLPPADVNRELIELSDTTVAEKDSSSSKESSDSDSEV